MMQHRDRFAGPELGAYERGWLDGDQDAKAENLWAGFWHGALWGVGVGVLITIIAVRFFS
jgi:hypothetical protein